jgi:hypothetical protein
VRITPTDALQILLPTYVGAEAALRLTVAMRASKCRLWCNGNPVAPGILLTLAVKPREETDGRWSATIVSTAREAWEHPPDYYLWEFDRNEVVPLLPPPTSDQGADDKPQLTGSRAQDEIRQIAAEEWPGGWENIPTVEIMQRVGEVLKKRGRRIRSRSTFERALGRRKD